MKSEILFPVAIELTKIKRQLNFIKLTLDREDIHPISLGQVLTNLITLP
jgi:hypothetical protein